MLLSLAIFIVTLNIVDAAAAHGSMRSYWIHFDPDRNSTVDDQIHAIVYFPCFGITEKVPLVVFAHGWGGSGDWYEFFCWCLSTLWLCDGVN